MKQKWLKYVLLVLFILYFICWLPWLIIKVQANSTSNLAEMKRADVGIIFGGLHKDGTDLSETNRERLLAGKALLEQKIVDRLLISNTPLAVEAMKNFLQQAGVPQDQIEQDTTAIVTEDTCISERNTHPDKRSAVLISHGYHLPRILFACKRAGVDGIGVPAEMIGRIERTHLPSHQVFLTRFTRYHREAGLTWLTIFGLYSPTVVGKF